ncbi:MAG: hypothetical protein KBG84_02925 [Planctomycetes bacterium]|nr:hypothetical protein [Planctomycetota bacterium]
MKRMILLLTCASALCVSSFPSLAQDAEEPDKPITIDLVRKDIRVVLHLLAPKEWTVNIDSDVNVSIGPVEFRSTKFTDVVKTICEACDLAFEIKEAEKTVSIHRKPVDPWRTLEVEFDNATQKVNCCFCGVTVVDAIIAICLKSGVQCLLSYVPVEGRKYKSGLAVYENTRASLYGEEMTVEEVLRHLAKQGDLTCEWRKVDFGDGEGWCFERIPED